MMKNKAIQIAWVMILVLFAGSMPLYANESEEAQTRKAFSADMFQQKMQEKSQGASEDPTTQTSDSPIAPKESQTSNAFAERSAEPSWIKSLWTTFIQQVGAWQSSLRSHLVHHAKIIRTDPWTSSLLIFLAICFLYGTAHALGPGHGKTIVSSYFFSRKASILQGIGMSFAVAMLHAASAVVVVLILYGGSKGVLGGIEQGRVATERLSYWLLAAVGIFLLVHSFVHVLRHKKHAHNHNTQAQFKEMALTAFAGGMIPCPATATVLLFSLAFDMLWLGLLGSLVIGVGMSITTSAFAVGTIGGRGFSLRFLQPNNPWAIRIHTGLEIVGAVLILLLAVVLLAGSYS